MILHRLCLYLVNLSPNYIDEIPRYLASSFIYLLWFILRPTSKPISFLFRSVFYIKLSLIISLNTLALKYILLICQLFLNSYSISVVHLVISFNFQHMSSQLPLKTFKISNALLFRTQSFLVQIIQYFLRRILRSFSHSLYFHCSFDERLSVSLHLCSFLYLLYFDTRFIFTSVNFSFDYV